MIDCQSRNTRDNSDVRNMSLKIEVISIVIDFDHRLLIDWSIKYETYTNNNVKVMKRYIVERKGSVGV